MATLTTAKVDSNAAKGDATAEGTTHGNSWICSIAVLLLQGFWRLAPRILSLGV
jgi:hypothetical protein